MQGVVWAHHVRFNQALADNPSVNGANFMKSYVLSLKNIDPSLSQSGKFTVSLKDAKCLDNTGVNGKVYLDDVQTVSNAVSKDFSFSLSAGVSENFNFLVRCYGTTIGSGGSPVSYLGRLDIVASVDQDRGAMTGTLAVLNHCTYGCFQGSDTTNLTMAIQAVTEYINVAFNGGRPF